MRKNIRIKITLILIISLVFLTNCNVGKKDEITEPDEIKNKLLNVMLEQGNYSFSGKSSMGFDEENIEDVVQFNGFINNKEAMYLKLNITALEGIPEESIEVVQLPEKMMVKYPNETDWAEENELDLFLGEIGNINPEKILSDIQNISIETAIIDEKEGKKGLSVKIDPEVTKEKIKEQIRSSFAEMGNLTEEEIQEMRDSGLTDEEIADIQEEMQGQVQGIEDMLGTLEVDTNFQIYYDPDDYLINEIAQSITTNYEMQGIKINEKTITSYQFSEYGKKKELPAT